VALRPEQIEQQEFSMSRKGFDRDQVRQFLVDVASQVRDLQTDAMSRVETESESTDSADGEVAAGHTIAPLAGQGLVDGDRFGALGERIAGLLRQAHEASEETREGAESEASRLRTEAQQVLDEANAEAERIREEMAAYRVQVEAEAVQIRNQAEIDGNALLDQRTAQVEQNEREIALEREAAMKELSEARSQVAVLLQEARAQSEFIRQEAEEIIRTKVRSNMDAAQRRIDVLRTTEESSKDRIITAQRELESALQRLESEPLPEFPADTEDLVLAQAEQALDAREAGMVAEAETAAEAAAIDAEAAVVDVVEVAEVKATDATEYTEVDNAEISNDSDWVADSDPAAEPISSAETFEHGVVYQPEADDSADHVEAGERADNEEVATFADAASLAVEDNEVPDLSQSDETATETEMVTEPQIETDGEADTEVAGVSNMFDVPSEPDTPEFPSSGFATTEFDSQPPVRDGHIEPPAAPMPIVDEQNPLTTEPSDETPSPENEDALARLVREAMQRAVESARSSD
jgi:DivIVA domain-containing protein